ncbi:MAG: PfkB family carbohydrate kinase [Actinomycetota bacterium]|nr:PfkB family carbohydrate kinase [Actinomycetota bacterium]
MLRDLVGVIGENLVDLIVTNDKPPVIVEGGGPFNVARTVARLGARSLALMGISEDIFGRRIRAKLLEDGVVLGYPDALVLPTTIAIAEVEDGVANYHFHLHDTAAFQIDIESLVQVTEEFSSELAALYIGTLALFVEPMATAGEMLIRNCADDLIVLIDPNCRPAAVRDRQNYLDRVHRIFARSDLVKVSTEDLYYLFGDVPHEESVRKIQEAGAGIVFVTNGGLPLELYHSGKFETFEVPKVDVVDTVGAGDSFVGGFLAYWLSKGYSKKDLSNYELVRRAVIAAMEVSSITCEREGAEPPLREELSSVSEWNRPSF